MIIGRVNKSEKLAPERYGEAPEANDADKAKAQAVMAMGVDYFADFLAEARAGTIRGINFPDGERPSIVGGEPIASWWGVGEVVAVEFGDNTARVNIGAIRNEDGCPFVEPERITGDLWVEVNKADAAAMVLCESLDVITDGQGRVMALTWTPLGAAIFTVECSGLGSVQDEIEELTAVET